MEYLRDPKEIYRLSYEIARTEADLSAFPSEMEDVVIRLIHACGMPNIVEDLRWSDGVISAACEVLKSGASIICDAQMVAEGINTSRLPSDNQVLSMIRAPNLCKIAKENGTTRLGNAPTALFRLLEIISGDASRKPALILAFPVGFVGAAESKIAVHTGSHGVPYLTLLGRRGGSAIAAASVNALAGK